MNVADTNMMIKIHTRILVYTCSRYDIDGGLTLKYMSY